MYLTFTNIRFNTIIPLLISFDGSAASIDPHTLEMHPNRNNENIQIANDSTVDDKNCL